MRNWFRASLLFLLLCSFFSAFPQVILHGKITGNTEGLALSKVFLGSYRSAGFTIIDSAELKIKTDTTFLFRHSGSLPYGMYEIVLTRLAGMPLIISPEDKDLRIMLRLKTPTEAELPVFNTENKAFTEFSLLFRNHMAHLSDITRKKSAMLSGTDPQTELITLKKENDLLLSSFNSLLQSLSVQYPHTYASDYLARIAYTPIYLPYDPARSFADYYSDEFAFMKNHYLEAIPFNDERILNNSFLTDKLFYYILNYSNRNPEGFKDCIDQIMAHAHSNPAVRSAVISFLTDVFISRGPDEVLTYISDNYLEGCSAGVPEVAIKRIKQRKNFKSGSPAPNLILPDSAGHTVSLYSLQKGKPLIVYFWASTCTHCQQETPQYIQLYKQFRDKGLQVYAVSLDEEKTSWTNAIRNMGLDWINVCDFKRFDSPAARAYFVYATPTLILLDSEGKILTINPTPDQLKANLEFLLETR